MWVALPDFDDPGNLPPGIHPATRAEVDARFGCTPARQLLVARLGRALGLLAGSGCRRTWLDGSFVPLSERTLGREPADFDSAGISPGSTWRRSRGASRPSTHCGPTGGRCAAATGATCSSLAEPLDVGLLAAFQFDRDGRRRGIVLLDPREGGA